MIDHRPLIVVMTIAVAAPNLACDDDNSPSLTVPTTIEAEEDPEDEAPDESDELDELEEFDDALAESDGATDAHAADLPDATDEQHAKFTRARTAFLSDQHDEAEELFRELALQKPITNQTISSAVALAQIYVETGRAEKAETLFDDLLDHAGHLPEVLLVVGRVYAELDEPDLAIDALDRAYEQQPDYIFLLPEIAEILFRQGDEDKAGQVLFRYEERLEMMVELLEDTDDTSDRKRQYFVDILGVVHDEAAHRALENVVADDPVDAIRAEAAIALGELGAVDARDTLEEAATDDDSETVRRAARHGLERLRALEAQAPEQ